MEVSYGKRVSDILMKFDEDLQFVNLKEVIKYLRQEDVISHQEWGQLVKKLDGKILQFLQEYIPLRGETAFLKFLKCLKKVGKTKLARDMEVGEFF